MSKRMLLLVMILVLLTPAIAEGYMVIDTPLFRESLTDETVPLRYYDDMPSVPYLGLSAYPALFLGEPMKVENRGGGTWVFTSRSGAQAEVDVGAGTLVCADFPAFTNLMDAVLPGMDNQYLDAPAFALPAGLEYADPAPVTLNFSKYHIPLRSDDDDVYLPLATLSDVFSNLAYIYVSFNGEKVYVNFDNRWDPPWQRDAGYADPIYRRADRAPDLAAFAYDELCFAIDTFYGYPGRAALNDDLAALSLDGALQAHSDTSRRCRELLKSEKLGEYVLGSRLLSTLLEDGGHTGFDFGSLYADKPEFADFATDYYMASRNDSPDVSAYAGSRTLASKQKLLRQKRREAWGRGHYAEQGDTAVIWFDSFMYDFDGWQAFYGTGGARPADDQMARVVDGLNRAAANPAIKNVVLDVSCNTGGSADMVVAIMSLIADVSSFRTENLLIRQIETHRYRVDRSFDGIFDGKDAGVRYDFNFGVLTSPISFSCGNLLPALMKDLGMVVLGERSGGGACAVEEHAAPEGFVYQFSSGLGRLVDAAGGLIDDGIAPDIPLDEDDFYDLDALGRAMNAFYADSLKPAA